MWTNAVRAPPAVLMATALTPKVPSAAAVRRATGPRLACQGPVQVGRVEEGLESLAVEAGS